MNGTQAQTGAAAIVAGLAGFAAGHGWLGLSITDWTTLLTATAGIAAIVWPVVATRLQALKTTVGNSGAKVITDTASAAASPSPNVIAATPEISIAVSKSQ